VEDVGDEQRPGVHALCHRGHGTFDHRDRRIVLEPAFDHIGTAAR
jgi:hypothetical protein